LLGVQRLTLGDSFLSGAEFDFAEYEGKPQKTYLICSTGRSGSTLLSSLLTNSGVMGAPHEYFHVAGHREPLIERFNIPAYQPDMMDKYFDAIIKYRTSPNGVFGLKAHITQCLKYFNNGFIKSYFGDIKFIFMLRRNTIAQAISLTIAGQTEKWTSHGTEKKQATYDFDKINRSFGLTSYQNALWERVFKANKITPHVIFYEDLLEAPTEQIQMIADFIGVDTKISIDLASAGLNKQATAQNREWDERFADEILRIFQIPC